MREIKYRAWDINGQVMAGSDFWGDVVRVHYGFNKVPSIMRMEHDEFVIMQFTGLRDYKVNEIYEDDIIRFNDCAYDRTGGNVNDSIRTGVVKYSYAAWVVQFGEQEFLLSDIHMNDDELEVIGNIHEHANLIKG